MSFPLSSKSNDSAISNKPVSTLFKICSWAKMLIAPFKKCNWPLKNLHKKIMSSFLFIAGFKSEGSLFLASLKWIMSKNKWIKTLKISTFSSANTKTSTKKSRKSAALSKKYFYCHSVLKNDRNQESPQDSKRTPQKLKLKTKTLIKKTRQLLNFHSQKMNNFYFIFLFLSKKSLNSRFPLSNLPKIDLIILIFGFINKTTYDIRHY